MHQHIQNENKYDSNGTHFKHIMLGTIFINAEKNPFEIACLTEQAQNKNVRVI